MAERAKKLTGEWHTIAANRLSDGITVWANRAEGEASYQWVTNWADATPVLLDEIDEMESWSDAQADKDVVISHRVIEVEKTANGFQPQRLRERICTAGPTFRLDLGKQAELN